jgi:hypothetical protein
MTNGNRITKACSLCLIGLGVPVLSASPIGWLRMAYSPGSTAPSSFRSGVMRRSSTPPRRRQMPQPVHRRRYKRNEPIQV